MIEMNKPKGKITNLYELTSFLLSTKKGLGIDSDDKDNSRIKRLKFYRSGLGSVNKVVFAHIVNDKIDFVSTSGDKIITVHLQDYAPCSAVKIMRKVFPE